VLTAWYALSPYIIRIRFVLKGSNFRTLFKIPQGIFTNNGINSMIGVIMAGKQSGVKIINKSTRNVILLVREMHFRLHSGADNISH
jgi:hypothetical protein